MNPKKRNFTQAQRMLMQSLYVKYDLLDYTDLRESEERRDSENIEGRETEPP